VLLRRADEEPVGDVESVVRGQGREDRRDVIGSKEVARDGAVVLHDRHVKSKAGSHEVLKRHPQGAGPLLWRRGALAISRLVKKQAEGPARVLHDRVLKPELLEGDPGHDLAQPVEAGHVVKRGIGDVQAVATKENKVVARQRLVPMLVPSDERGPGHTCQ